MPDTTAEKLAHLPSLRPGERKALAAFLAGLEKRFAQVVEEVILFGSKARGDATAESDIDLLVLVRSDDWCLQWDIPALAARSAFVRGREGVISAKVMSLQHYGHVERLQTAFYRNIRLEGVPLWRKFSGKA